MKKIIISSIFFIGLGFFSGELIFGSKKDIFKNFNSKDTYYFLEEGVYIDKKDLNKNYVSKRLVEKDNKKYYVYVGITKDKEVIEKLKDIYNSRGISLSIKEKEVNSKEFFENVSQFDFLIKETTEEDEILTIEEVILSNYEEITKKTIKN
ncbi:MAG: hypothetical protein IJ842_00655 [Bacilli bacterium]|nr:hypothetical protein [Bacilli bacterium]